VGSLMESRWRQPIRSGLIAVALVFVASGGAGLKAVADDFWMADEDLQATFAGVTIDGHYADGRHFTERYGSDMALDYSEGPRQTTGHWSVASGTFCTIYEGDPSGGCFRVARVGANCFEFYFVARTEDQVRRRQDGKPGWSARGWVKGRSATCRDEPIV